MQLLRETKRQNVGIMAFNNLIGKRIKFLKIVLTFKFKLNRYTFMGKIAWQIVVEWQSFLNCAHETRQKRNSPKKRNHYALPVCEFKSSFEISNAVVTPFHCLNLRHCPIIFSKTKNAIQTASHLNRIFYKKKTADGGQIKKIHQISFLSLILRFSHQFFSILRKFFGIF